MNISEHGRIRDHKGKWTGFQHGYITMSLKLMREVWCTNQVTKRLQKVRVSNRTARKGEFSAFTDVSSSAHKCCRLWTLLSQNTGSCFHTKTVKFTCQETSWMVKTPSPSLSLGERKWQCGSRLYHQLRATLRPPSTARPGKKNRKSMNIVLLSWSLVLFPWLESKRMRSVGLPYGSENNGVSSMRYPKTGVAMVPWACWSMLVIYPMPQPDIFL